MKLFKGTRTYCAATNTPPQRILLHIILLLLVSSSLPTGAKRKELLSNITTTTKIFVQITVNTGHESCDQQHAARVKNSSNNNSGFKVRTATTTTATTLSQTYLYSRAYTRQRNKTERRKQSLQIKFGTRERTSLNATSSESGPDISIVILGILCCYIFVLSPLERVSSLPPQLSSVICNKIQCNCPHKKCISVLVFNIRLAPQTKLSPTTISTTAAKPFVILNQCSIPYISILQDLCQQILMLDQKSLEEFTVIEYGQPGNWNYLKVSPNLQIQNHTQTKTNFLWVKACGDCYSIRKIMSHHYRRPILGAYFHSTTYLKLRHNCCHHNHYQRNFFIVRLTSNSYKRCLRIWQISLSVQLGSFLFNRILSVAYLGIGCLKYFPCYYLLCSSAAAAFLSFSVPLVCKIRRYQWMKEDDVKRLQKIYDGLIGESSYTIGAWFIGLVNRRQNLLRSAHIYRNFLNKFLSRKRERILKNYNNKNLIVVNAFKTIKERTFNFKSNTFKPITSKVRTTTTTTTKTTTISHLPLFRSRRVSKGSSPCPTFLIWLLIGLICFEAPKIVNSSIIINHLHDVPSTTQAFNKFQQQAQQYTAAAATRRTGNSATNNHKNAFEADPADAGKVRLQNIRKHKAPNNHNNKNDFVEYNSIRRHTANCANKTNIPSVLPNIITETNTNHQLSYLTRSFNSASLAEVISSIPKQENSVHSDYARLESIKRQILSKLGLEQKPNVSRPLPKQFIWDTIYRADGINSITDFDLGEVHATDTNNPTKAHFVNSQYNGLYVASHHPFSVDGDVVDDDVDLDDVRASETSASFIAQHYQRNNLNIRRLAKLKSNNNYHYKLTYLSSLSNANSSKTKDDSNNSILNATKDHNSDEINYSFNLQHSTPADESLRRRKSEDEDDFFGNTQEIITFAEEGSTYKEHRLIEFPAQLNKLPNQKLFVRSAEIHIRIDKINSNHRPPAFHNTPVFLARGHRSRADEVNFQQRVKLWIFQLTGNNHTDKGYDEISRFCGSFDVDIERLGWQKFDITSTVRHWYENDPRVRLRLLIDCTGCGEQYALNLFEVSAMRDKNNEKNETRAAQQEGTKKRLRKKPQKQRTPKPHPKLRVKNMKSLKKSKGTSTPKERKNKLNKTRKTKLKESDVRPKHYLSESRHHGPKSLSTNNDQISPHRPFLVLHTETRRLRRARRHAVDCKGAMHGQCCKESFYVSFKALGWDDWIIAPRGYFANYCRGDCTGPFRTPDSFQTFHAHFIEEYRKMGLLNGMQPCCAPVKFSSMSLIYYGDDGIIKRDLPKMVVDECGCP